MVIGLSMESLWVVREKEEGLLWFALKPEFGVDREASQLLLMIFSFDVFGDYGEPFGGMAGLVSIATVTKSVSGERCFRGNTKL